MEQEEDVVVVIVGDVKWQSESSELQQPIEVKQEICNEGEVDVQQPIEVKEEISDAGEVDVTVEDLMKVAKKYGEYLPCDTPEEVSVKIEKIDSHDPEYLPAGDEYLDEDKEYQEDDNGDNTLNKSDSDSGNKYNNPRKQPFRKSFVEELRTKYPELRKNNSELVKVLLNIMKNVKRPIPPQDFFIMNGIMYECLKCGTLSETQPAVWRHYQEKHGTRYLVCYACGVDFRSTTNLYKHEKTCSAQDSMIVLQARALFLGRKGRGRPFLPEETRKKTYYKKEFPCTMCSAVFYSKKNLESHVNLHRGERPYRCHVCPRAYTAYTTLLRHVQTHTNQQYICDHCGRSFKVKAALIAHLDTHLSLRKFACHFCDRRYVQRAALNVHINGVHLNLPKPFACQICPRRFNRMSLLKDHMKKLHGLSLMTRKMFFKELPTLTDTQLEQAITVLKTDVMVTPPSPNSSSHELNKENELKDYYTVEFSE